MQIYRILQEAVSNISRHANAARVRLIVKTSSEGDFLLTLEDDGRDFDPQDRKIKQGRGLMNIRARASLIEAEVNWRKRDGGGTQFTLRKANAVKTSAAQIEG
jgi:signal transduction histidine kinase